jgi:hypothetical protein
VNFTESGSQAPPEAKIFDKMTATDPFSQFLGELGREHRRCPPFRRSYQSNCALAIGQPLVNGVEGLKGEAAVAAEA